MGRVGLELIMSVPNTFSGGTLISAAQVNENFSYLDSLVSGVTPVIRGGTGTTTQFTAGSWVDLH